MVPFPLGSSFPRASACKNHLSHESYGKITVPSIFFALNDSYVGTFASKSLVSTRYFPALKFSILMS